MIGPMIGPREVLAQKIATPIAKTILVSGDDLQREFDANETGLLHWDDRRPMHPQRGNP